MRQAKPMIFAGLCCFVTSTALARGSVDFDRYDTNGDGYLTESEWRNVDQAAKDFDLIDTNRDGRLDKAEVKAGMSGEHDGSRNISGQQASGEMDNRNDPALSSAEDRTRPAQRVSAPESQPREVSLYDTDQDGRVSRSEAQKDGELVTYFVTWDTNQDGYLDQNELDTGSRQTGGDNVNYGDRMQDRPARSSAGQFESRDTNDDGLLDETEISDDDYVGENFEMWDANDDGLLDETEVDDDWAEWNDDSFDTYDVNDDGLLDDEEVFEYDFINYNFDGWDTNRDGVVSEDEADAGLLDDNDDDKDNGVFEDDNL